MVAPSQLQLLFTPQGNETKGKVMKNPPASFTSIFLMSGLLALSSGTAFASKTNTAGPNYPSESSRDLVITYSTHQESPNLSLSKDGSSGPNKPPPTPEPGDRRSQEWTECDDNHCTRHHRTDRYQREDAPINQPDPWKGSGPFNWVPISWGSQSCASFIICTGGSGPIFYDPQ